jgi:hypothetical protein
VATVERAISVGPDAVFAVLADGWTYANWVVGTSHMRAVDTSWPEAGAELHHASGIWPLVIRDVTTVIECTSDQLVLEASGRPLGKARITMHITPASGGCEVTMTEVPTAGPGAWVHNPLQDRLIARRNTEALARLAAIAERATTPRD